jgi:hypothetical protein
MALRSVSMAGALCQHITCVFSVSLKKWSIRRLKEMFPEHKERMYLGNTRVHCRPNYDECMIPSSESAVGTLLLYVSPPSEFFLS